MSKRPFDLRDMVARRCSDAKFAEAQRQLRDTMAKAKSIGLLTGEQIRLFDAACNHPYECQCPLCLEWWSLKPLIGMLQPKD